MKNNRYKFIDVTYDGCGVETINGGLDLFLCFWEGSFFDPHNLFHFWDGWEGYLAQETTIWDLLSMSAFSFFLSYYFYWLWDCWEGYLALETITGGLGAYPVLYGQLSIAESFLLAALSKN